jgi:hypothetical protein
LTKKLRIELCHTGCQGQPCILHLRVVEQKFTCRAQTYSKDLSATPENSAPQSDCPSATVAGG